MRLNWRLNCLGGGCLLAALLCGCGVSTGPTPISTSDFYNRHQVGEAPLSVTDQPGQVVGKDMQAKPPVPPPAGSGAPTAISEAVQEVIPPPGATTLPAITPSEMPSTMESTQASTEPEISPGGYMELGTVVAEVNGTPIYANKILRINAALLRERAKADDIETFRIDVNDLFLKTIREQIADELEVAAAAQELGDKDKQMAEHLTQLFYTSKIQDAGGSLAIARQRALESGEDLDEQVEDEHRRYLQLLYYTKKVNPLVHVTADDERRYYDKHRDSEFSTPTQADVYILFADSNDLGDEQATKNIEDFRRRAIAGEDIAQLVQYNKNTALRSMMTIEPNSFALTNVEAAVWKLSPGQVSGVIDDTGGKYVVKLINLRKGGVDPFEDEKVQDAIRQKLEHDQLIDLQTNERQRLLDMNESTFDAASIEPAVEMAMENYTRWRNE
jgi:parvulin-like peptidyl-prolyl isomerase